MTQYIAKVRTKTNFKNLNNTWIKIKYFDGDKIMGEYEGEEGQKFNSFFYYKLHEILEIKKNKS